MCDLHESVTVWVEHQEPNKSIAASSLSEAAKRPNSNRVALRIDRQRDAGVGLKWLLFPLLDSDEFEM